MSIGVVSAYYYYGRDEQVSGPVGLDELGALLLERRIDEQTPLWSEARDWSPLGEALPQFNPPPPPAATPLLPPPLPRTLLPVAVPEVRPQRDAEPEAGWHLQPPHPWRRWLARLIDHYSIGLLGYIVLTVPIYALSDDIAATEAILSSNIVASMGVTLISMPLCALCIGLSGTTPGKWCAGLRVVARDGGMLGLGRALRRELRIWVTGLGLAIPLVALICMASAYSELMRERRMAWDEELDAVVHYRDDSFWNTARLVIAALLVAALAATLIQLGAARYAERP